MGQVSTIYDKDLNAKVFQVRDSERYTNSTQTFLGVSYVNNRRDYVTVTLTANVEKDIGNSSVAFYCNNQLVGISKIRDADNSKAISVHVPYGYNKYYAKYLGNDQCLSSKSGVVELEINESNIPKTYLTLTLTGLDTNNWIGSIKQLGATLTLKTVDGDVALTDKTVTVEVVGVVGVQEYTFDGASLDLSDLFNSIDGFNGLTTIKVVYEGDNEYIGDEIEMAVRAGYDLSATANYPKIGAGDVTVITASLHKYDGTPMENKQLTFEEELNDNI